MKNLLRNYLKEINPDLLGTLNINVIEEGKNNFLKPLDKNGYQHSVEIEQTLNRLLKIDAIKLKDIITPEETYILLASVYLHDIGYAVDNKLVSEGHPKRSYNKILSNYSHYGLSNEREAEAVANVCLAHGGESLLKLSDIEDRFGIKSNREPVDLQFCAALLRIADELQNESQRVKGFFNQEESLRNLIQFCDIHPERWMITFESRPKKYEEYEGLVRIKENVRNILRECRPYLEKRGLLYREVLLKPDRNPFPPPYERLAHPLELIPLPRILQGINEVDFRKPVIPKFFIGRRKELEKIKNLINLWEVNASDISYISIIGDSGIGKSSFAMKVSDLNRDTITLDIRGCSVDNAIQELIFSVASNINKDRYIDIIEKSKFTPASKGTELYKEFISELVKNSDRYIVILDQLEAIFSSRVFLEWMKYVIQIVDSPLLFIGCIRTDDVVMQVENIDYNALQLIVGNPNNSVKLNPISDIEIEHIFYSINPNLSSFDLIKVSEKSSGLPWKAKRIALLTLSSDEFDEFSDDKLFSLDISTLGITEIFIINEIAILGKSTKSEIEISIPFSGIEEALEKLLEIGLLIKIGNYFYLYHDKFRRYLTINSPFKEAKTAQSLVETANAFAEKNSWVSVGEILSLGTSIAPSSLTACLLEASINYIEDRYINGLGEDILKLIALPSFAACILSLKRDYLKRGMKSDSVDTLFSILINKLDKANWYIGSDYLRRIDCESNGLKVDCEVLVCRSISFLISNIRRTKNYHLAWGGAEPNAHETSQAILGLLSVGIRNTDEILVKMCDYLMSVESKCATNSDAWPYYVGHGKVKESTYTTAWCVEALRYYVDISGVCGQISKSVEWILSKQIKPSGGWSRPDNFSSATRETAIIISSLSEVKHLLKASLKEKCIEAIDKGLNFLKEMWKGQSKGFIYGDENETISIHSTSYASLAILSLDRSYFDSIKHDLTSFYIANQSKDGGFGYIDGGFSNPVPEATAISIRVLGNIRCKASQLMIVNATDWLKKNQLAEGCWEDKFIHQVSSVLRSVHYSSSISIGQ